MFKTKEKKKDKIVHLILNKTTGEYTIYKDTQKLYADVTKDLTKEHIKDFIIFEVHKIIHLEEAPKIIFVEEPI